MFEGYRYIVYIQKNPSKKDLYLQIYKTAVVVGKKSKNILDL